MRRYRIASLLALATLVFVAGGCPVIVSDQPLGSEVAVLDAERLNGAWLYRGANWLGWGEEGGGVLQVRVLDAQAGALTVEEPCEPPSVASDREATIELLWRRQAFSKACPGCAFYFALEKAREDGETSPYVTSYTVLSDGKSFAVLYRVAPDVENRILWLVGKGALPGHLMSNSPDSPVVLGPLSSKHYELMLSVETGLFDWHQPTVFVKLPDDLDPCKKPARSR